MSEIMQIERELARLGVDSCAEGVPSGLAVNPVDDRDDLVGLGDDQVAVTLRARDALAALRALPDGAGWDETWQALGRLSDVDYGE